MAVVNWTEHARDDLREVFDFIARYREILLGSYRIQYRVEPDTVWIATVVHGSRLLTP